jgi:ABC-type branched-subunit amino acid transport system substrate-binding protein
MALHSFRVTILGAAATFLALAGAAALSGCTPQPEQPQVVVPAGPPPAPPVEVAPAPPPGPAPTPLQTVTAGRAKVALLVPLSGPNKQVGQAMLDAANMALFDVSADLAVMPRDTGSTVDGARAAAVQAMSDGAGMVLGPVFSASVQPVREATAGTQANIITYSTDATVAGGNVYVMGFLPTGQVDRVVGFAKSRGMTKLAALVPDNPYGVAVTGEINAIKARLGLMPPRILVLARDPKTQLASLTDDPPDMLLVALGGDQLQSVAPALAEYETAHPVQLLGTGLWADDATLGHTPGLAGGWYASPPPENFAGFASRFQQLYSYRPPRIATLAYDSVALAASISRGSAASPTPFSADQLLQPNGFIGIDGGFRFLASGLSERNLAVLAIGPDGPTVVDPAPPSFEKLGQ